MAKKRNTGLGKGLDALFGDLDTSDVLASGSTSAAKDADQIDIDKIKPNENQPRRTFNEDALEELASSIHEHGVIQPIIVRPHNEGYEIVAGERRWRASRKAGLHKVPCLVRDLTDEQIMLIAIIENMQREDLNPVEEAEGLSSMINSYGLTQEQISRDVGKSRPYITNSLRLLKLPEEIRNMMICGDLSSGHGRALLAVDDRETQIKFAQKAVNEGLSVREVEALIKKKPVAKSRKRVKDPDVVRIEKDLKRILGTRVNINQSGKKGKIEIEYFSRDELERLLEMLESL